MMDQNYEMALSEVDEILNYTDEELVKKIPIQLRILISNNKNKEYKPNIDRTRPISEQELLELILWTFKISKIKFTYPSKLIIVIHPSLMDKINLYKIKEEYKYVI